MALLTGTASWSRFDVHDALADGWRQRFREALVEHTFVKPPLSAWKGERLGWCRHDNLFDTTFEEDHWLHDPWVVLGFRVDRRMIGSKELKGRLAIRIRKWCKERGTDRAPKSVRLELREALEQELAPRAPVQRKHVEVLWNVHDGRVFVGTTATNTCDKIRRLFLKTFGLHLQRHNPLWRLEVEQAQALALVVSAHLGREEGGGLPDEPLQAELFDLPPFVAGPELLVWTWWRSDGFGAVDGMEIFVDHRVELVSPQLNADRVTVRGEKTSSAPEAFTGMRRGKLPKAVQLLIRDGDEETLFVLDQTLGVTGAKLPPCLGDPEEHISERADKIATLDDRVGDLIAAYAEVRLDETSWPESLAAIRVWVADGGRVDV